MFMDVSPSRKGAASDHTGMDIDGGGGIDVRAEAGCCATTSNNNNETYKKLVVDIATFIVRVVLLSQHQHCFW
jgi:hypothetical protein